MGIYMLQILVHQDALRGAMYACHISVLHAATSSGFARCLYFQRLIVLDASAQNEGSSAYLDDH